MSSLALGIDLISYPYILANNLEEKEQKYLTSKLKSTNFNTSNKSRPSTEIIESVEKIINKLAKKHEIWILPYQSNQSLWNLCAKKRWKKAFIHPSLAQKLEDKSKLKNLFKRENFLIPSEIVPIKKCQWGKLKNKWKGQFVFQIIRATKEKPYSGGKGTFLIDNKKKFLKALSHTRVEDKVKISKYIKGDSFITHGCVIQKQLLITNPWPQIIGPKECSLNPASHNGSDWSAIEKYPTNMKEQAQQITKKIGKKLIKKGYKGLFNIDLILDKESSKMYLLEINPRQGGSTGILNYLHKINNIPSILDYHIKSFLGDNVATKTLKQDKKHLLTDLKGARLLMRSLEKKVVKIKHSPKPGIYRWNEGKNKLQFLRKGWNPTQLKEKNKILIYSVVPEGYILKPHKRILNIFSPETIIGKDAYHLNERFQKITRYLYKQFKFKTYKT